LGSVLVTGAAGQIGSELVVELRRRLPDQAVVAADLSTKLPPGVQEQGPNITVDVTDGAQIARVFEEHGVDTVYHLAGILSATGEQKPRLAWNTNIGGLYNVLEAARTRGARVFWPSSISVFGPDSPRVNTPQNAVMIPSTIYGASKVAGELLCNYYYHRFGVDVRSVRYPGIVSSETLPGGGTTDYAARMYYEAIERGQYTCFVRRDTTLPMMYIPDAIKAAFSIMDAESGRVTIRTSYNLTAMSFSAGELAEEIWKHIPNFECTFEPDFRQAIADSWPVSIDDSLARAHWGWNPDYDLSSMTTDILRVLGERIRK
jgi:nucleoside-diphosphate-sugar epimerase